jgi:hypothetical protein
MGVLSFLFGATGIAALTLVAVLAIVRCADLIRSGAPKPAAAAAPAVRLPLPTPAQGATPDAAAGAAEDVQDPQLRQRRHIRRLGE